MIFQALRDSTKEAATLEPNSSLSLVALQKHIQLCKLYGEILIEEAPPLGELADSRRKLRRHSSRSFDISQTTISDDFTFENSAHCDFCGADIFTSCWECATCSTTGPNECIRICPHCYIEGRSCRCGAMTPKQFYDFKHLMAIMERAINVFASSNLQKITAGKRVCGRNARDVSSSLEVVNLMLKPFVK